MPERRRAGHRVAGILVVAVLVTATGIAIRYGVRGQAVPGRAAVSLTVNENSPLAELNEALAGRDHRMLAIIEGRAHAQTRVRKQPIPKRKPPSGSKRLPPCERATGRCTLRPSDCGHDGLPDLRSVCR